MQWILWMLWICHPPVIPPPGPGVPVKVEQPQRIAMPAKMRTPGAHLLLKV